MSLVERKDNVKYKEQKDTTEPYKKAYLDGLECTIKKRQKRAEEIRAGYAKNIFGDQEKFRNDLKKCWDGRLLTIIRTNYLK